MNVIIHILTQNILPLFLLIGLGFLLGKRFDLQVTTLTKINFYLFVPSFTFVNLYQAEIRIDAVKALLITILILILNSLLSHVMAKIRRYDKGMRYAFQNSIMFYNSGNIGIPLITLVFSTGLYLVGDQAPYLTLAVTTQIMVLVVQNISVNTLGFFNAGRARNHWKQAVVSVLKMPTAYMVSLAFILKALQWDITGLPVWPVLNYARNGLVPVALLSLGVQLAASKLTLGSGDVWLAVCTRLLAGPLLALPLILLFRLDGVIAQVIFISAAVPTAVNTALIAVEQRNHPDFATQVVIVATLLSSLTLTGVIYLAARLFPI